MIIPSGSAATTGDGGYWYIKNGMRYLIPSKHIYDSWNFPTTFSVSASYLEDRTTYGGVLGFRPGTMVYSLAHGGYWYVSDKGRHKIASPDYFKKTGTSRWRLSMASRKDLELHEDLGVIE